MAQESNNCIRIVAIIGSVRPNNNTSKALRIVTDEIEKNKNVSLQVFDPNKLNLPFPGMGTNPDIEKLQKAVSEATGIILATPEYHGSFSSVIKLVIENLEFPSAMSGKPVALLGVASGQIGAVKSLEHLRSVCSHVGAIVLPGPVSVANVHKLFDEQGNCLDEKIETRIRNMANNLIKYIKDYVCPKIAFEEMVRQESSAK